MVSKLATPHTQDLFLTRQQRRQKRLVDIVVAAISLIIAAPFMLLMGLLIKRDSPGPVLFKQQRVGEGGHLFTMYKFRTMIDGADDLPRPMRNHKVPDDTRTTRLGGFLRRTSLDELPQLINVLRGEMSLVGPRPEMVWLVEQYEPWQFQRLTVPQGITGWWQINGRSDRPMHLHTADDLYYIENYSLWLDIFILLQTPWVVISRQGAY